MPRPRFRPRPFHLGQLGGFSALLLCAASRVACPPPRAIAAAPTHSWCARHHRRLRPSRVVAESVLSAHRRPDAPTGERNLRRCPRAKCPGEVPWRSALASNVWWAVPGAAAGLVRPPRPARTPEVCRAPRPRPPGRRGRRGRVLERSDVAERRIRTLQGAIGLRRARVPPYSMLIWRPLPSAEAANPLPSDVSGLPPHTHRILTLLSLVGLIRVATRQA